MNYFLTRVKSLINSILFKNFTWNAFGQISNKIFLFLINVYFARILSPRYYGEIIFAQTILLFLSTISSDLGLRLISIRNIALNESKSIVDLFSIPWSIMLMLSFISFIGMLLFSFFFNNGTVRILLLLFALGVPLYALNLDWILKGLQKFRIVGLGEALKSSLYLVICIVFIRSKNDIILIPVGYLIGYLSCVLFIFFVIKKLNKLPNFIFSLSSYKGLLVNSIPLGLVGFIAQAYLNSPFIFLKILSTPEQIGYYAAVTKITYNVTTLGAIFGEVLLPRMSSLYSESRNRTKKLVKKIFFLLFLFSFVFALVLFLFSKDIILIIYGPKYLYSITILKILSFAMAALIINVPFYIYLIVTKKNKQLISVVFIGALANLAFNYMFIPHFGSLGAAYTELITEIIVLSGFIFFSVKDFRA